MTKKVIDLTKSLPKHDGQWVAINKDGKIIAHEKTFNKIVLVTKNQSNLSIMPASKNYFGFAS